MTPWLVHELRGRGLNVVCLGMTLTAPEPATQSRSGACHPHSAAVRALSLGGSHMEVPVARFVGLDVSQKLTSICVVDDAYPMSTYDLCSQAS
jgi:hypothetical protein